jgi:PTH1 family peptidyl-tRNA hydrolase
VSEGVVSGKEVTVLLPSTHMNASGSAVGKLIPSGHSHELMVIYDDVDLPLGEFKISFDRGDGGHNGIKSIRESLGTSEFARLRVGIAKKGLFGTATRRPQGDKLAQYVLSPFSKGELKTLDALRDTVRDVLVTFITEGIEKTMNRFN